MPDRRQRRGPGDVLYFVWALPLVLSATVIKSLKGSWWTKIMGRAEKPVDGEVAHGLAHINVGSSQEERIATAVRRAARRLPGKHECLAQAIAGQMMLSAVGTPGIVMVGLRPTTDSVRWDGHAWLVGSEGIILGGEIAREFVPVTTYRKRTVADG